MKEEWRSLKGLVPCGDYYEVSNLGRVRSIDRTFKYKDGRIFTYKGVVLKQNQNKKTRYMYVDLRIKNKRKKYTVHRLVGIAFIPNPNNLPCINHKDEKHTNNIWTNLEWCTREYNNKYGTAIERATKTRHEKGVYKRK